MDLTEVLQIFLSVKLLYTIIYVIFQIIIVKWVNSTGYVLTSFHWLF